MHGMDLSSIVKLSAYFLCTCDYNVEGIKIIFDNWYSVN